MSVPTSLKKVETEINDELKSLKLRAYIEIKGFDEKTRAIIHNIGFHDSFPNKTVLKIHEVIRKHLEKWLKTH